MDKWFDSYWVETSGLTQHDIELWKERRKLDRECSVEMETEMLSPPAGSNLLNVCIPVRNSQ